MQNLTNHKLKEVVKILKDHKIEIDEYYEKTIFEPFQISDNCFVEKDMKSIRRLFEFSLTTRQGGTTKKTTDEYKKVENKVDELLEEVVKILLNKNIDAKEQNKRAFLKLLNEKKINGMNQKIISMFLKFLIYHSSENFDCKSELDRELFIPLDIHVLRFLFKKIEKGKKDKKTEDGIDLFDEFNEGFWHSIQQSSLSLPRNIKKIDKTKKRQKFFLIQDEIKRKFEEAEITESPIILDYLWYVGTTYCRYRNLPKLGCKICWLKCLCSELNKK